MEYRSVAAAFGWGWHEMVDIALDAVDACWLDDSAKVVLRRQITAAATALTS
jgi:adenosine deaminase